MTKIKKLRFENIVKELGLDHNKKKAADLSLQDWIRIINTSQEHAIWAAGRDITPKVIEILLSLGSQDVDERLAGRTDLDPEAIETLLARGSSEVAWILAENRHLPKVYLERLAQSPSTGIKITARVTLRRPFSLKEIQELTGVPGNVWTFPVFDDPEMFDEEGKKVLVALRSAERRKNICRLQEELAGKFGPSIGNAIKQVLAKSIDLPIWIAPTAKNIDEEIAANAVTIGVGTEERFALGRSFFASLFENIALKAKEALLSSGVKTDLILYFFEGNYFNLTWNIIRADHPSLPFGRKVKSVTSEEFLNSFLDKEHLKSEIARQEKLIRYEEGKASGLSQDMEEDFDEDHELPVLVGTIKINLKKTD